VDFLPPKILRLKEIKTMKVFIANNPEALMAINPTHSVEAEFGDLIVSGSALTLGHHGPRAGQLCPCLGDNFPPAKGEIIVAVSHFDLDALGGVMRVLGLKREVGIEPLFWRAAAQIDIMGVHHLKDIGEGLKPSTWMMDPLTPEEATFTTEWKQVVEVLEAFWAWSQEHRLFAPREGEVLDCTAFYMEAAQIVRILLEGNPLGTEHRELVQAGKAWAQANQTLNEESLGVCTCYVLGRVSDRFVNHLYATPKEHIAWWGGSWV